MKTRLQQTFGMLVLSFVFIFSSAKAQTTVVDIIVNSPDHTTLETAVIAAGLADDLSGTGPFTVFAPTDAAFAALPAGTLDALLSDPTGALAQILLYHVASAKVMSSVLTDEQMIKTLQGKKVKVDIIGTDVFINNAKVTVKDLVADNGVVHVIDAVLIPSTLPATVVDIVVNSPDHNTLEAAVVAAGLVETLQGDGPFTVFAPTDAAFAALPAGTVEALLADIPALTNILTYHVAGGNVLSSDLSDNQIITTLQGKKIKVNIVAGEVFINNAKVTVANVKADNGVVHVIDAVLIPSADIVIKDSGTMGKILTDTYGSSLYFFSKDAFNASLCVDGCLTNWPVFYVENMEFGAGLDAADFATIDRGSGVMQTTYKGWPLYYFANDSRPGVISGDGVIGKWFIAKPDYTIMITDNQLTGNDGIKYKGDYTAGDEIIQYFTDGKGLTLYTWKNDKFNINKFTKPDFSNNGVWPVYEQNKIVLPSVLANADFKVINVFGKDQLTYKGWPLYYFGQDMMLRGNNKGVSFPTPGVWPVAVKNMMKAPITVVDIIINSSDHSILETAVIAAELADDLSGTGPFTVFAPTDAAFEALPAGVLDDLLLDPTGKLAQILLYHVANGKVMSTDLSDEQLITTLQGKTVKVDIIAGDVFINNAKVTAANLVADNGVVHVIDAVLLPPADKAAFPIDFETVTDAVWTVFSNGAGAPDDFMVIPNPDKTGNNTSDNVLKFKVNDGADPWAGAFSDSYAPFEITQNSHKVTVMVWKSVISPVGFKVEGSTNGGPVTELKVSNTLTNQWEKLTFDLSALIGYSYNRIVIFPDFPGTRTSGTIAYIDNIERKAQTTVVDIIVNSPDHTILETAVIAAELADDLSGTGPFTVFAPTDAAFNALPAGVLDDLLLDPTGKLAQILLYHVANGKMMSTDLSDEQLIATLQGKTVKVDIIAGDVFINNAKVTAANLVADNGVVHVIDAVLLPPADKAAFPIDFETVTDAVWTVFSNGAGAPDDFMVIPNPDKTGNNTSDNVLKFKVNDGADPWAGAFSDSYAPVEFTQQSHVITMMVWKSVISNVAFKVEASTNGGPVKEVKVPNTLTNQWEKITFDLSELIGFSYNRIVIFPDFPDTRTSGTTAYIDNIEKLDFTAVPRTNVKHNIKVYPNPVVDVLNVTFSDPKAEVAIYNSLGLLVESAVFVGKNARFDVSKYSPGLYFIKVNNGSVVKFIK